MLQIIVITIIIIIIIVIYYNIYHFFTNVCYLNKHLVYIKFLKQNLLHSHCKQV
jgi:hypothetical protein